MSMNNLGFTATMVNATGPGIASTNRSINRFARNSTAAATQVKRGWEGAFPALMALGVVRQLGRALGGLVKPSLEFNDVMRKMAFAADITDVKLQGLTGTAKTFFDEINKQGTASRKTYVCFDSLSK